MRVVHHDDVKEADIMALPGIVRSWPTWAPQILGILRIVTAALFIFSGTIKLFAYPMGMPPDGSTAPFLSQAWIGGVLEVFGGALLLVGLFTRPVAFILSGEMAVAYFQFHAPGGFWPQINGGMPAILMCFIFLYFSAAGPGPWSLDALRKK
jgi:putative oxidoreductase